MSPGQPLERDPIPRTPVYTDAAAEARAQRLGLPGGTRFLVAAVLDGASGARATTKWHPRVYRGDRMWGETVASLRHHLDGFWEPETICNVDLVVERRRGIAIIVTAGNVATGFPEHVPQVRYERKEVITALIGGAADSLFGPGTRPAWEVWFLLHWLNGPTLRGELSWPNGIGKSGFVSSWAERIILPVTDFGDPDGNVRRNVDDGPPDVGVEVQRRAG